MRQIFNNLGTKGRKLQGFLNMFNDLSYFIKCTGTEHKLMELIKCIC